MKKFLKKIAFFALIVLLYFVVTGTYNYTLDPYGILGNRKEFNGIRPNSHSLKVNHVLNSEIKFNSFLFSNSKGGVLHFNQLNNKKDTWYNMTYSLGTPEEFYKDIVLFLEKGIPINKIVVGLDESTIYERAISHKNQASRKFVTLEKDQINWEYLFLPISLKKKLNTDLKKKHIVYDFFNDGNYYEKNAYDLKCDVVENLELQDYPPVELKGKLDFTAKKTSIQNIKDICKTNGIELTFIVHPCSYDNYLASAEKRNQLNVLIKELEYSGIEILQPFGNHLMKKNSCSWRDNHHYTKKIGDSILKLYQDYKFATKIDSTKK